MVAELESKEVTIPTTEGQSFRTRGKIVAWHRHFNSHVSYVYALDNGGMALVQKYRSPNDEGEASGTLKDSFIVRNPEELLKRNLLSQEVKEALTDAAVDLPDYFAVTKKFITDDVEQLLPYERSMRSTNSGPDIVFHGTILVEGRIWTSESCGWMNAELYALDNGKILMTWSLEKNSPVASYEIFETPAHVFVSLLRTGYEDEESGLHASAIRLLELAAEQDERFVSVAYRDEHGDNEGYRLYRQMQAERAEKEAARPKKVVPDAARTTPFDKAHAYLLEVAEYGDGMDALPKILAAVALYLGAQMESAGMMAHGEF